MGFFSWMYRCSVYQPALDYHKRRQIAMEYDRVFVDSFKVTRKTIILRRPKEMKKRYHKGMRCGRQ